MSRMFVVRLAVGALLLFVTAGAAFAEAGRPASCMGHESSGVSPPGSSEEIPDGRKGLNVLIKSEFPDAPPGAAISTIAKLHEGSHEACGEALEG
jgi:formylmethanofuran:tetrahydromethanopterin formyltransferase